MRTPTRPRPTSQIADTARCDMSDCKVGFCSLRLHLAECCAAPLRSVTRCCDATIVTPPLAVHGHLPFILTRQNHHHHGQKCGCVCRLQHARASLATTMHSKPTLHMHAQRRRARLHPFIHTCIHTMCGVWHRHAHNQPARVPVCSLITGCAAAGF